MSDYESIALEVDALCCELVEEIIDEPKLRRLEKLVLEHHEAKEVYVEYLNLHVSLRHCASALRPAVLSLEAQSNSYNPLPSPEVSDGISSEMSPQSLPGLPYFGVPLAGILILLGLVGLYLLGSRGLTSRNSLDTAEIPQVAHAKKNKTKEPSIAAANSEYVAELTGSDLANGNADHPLGSMLAKGEVLRIKEGSVHIRFACEAEVTLHGPAVFHIVSEKLAHLEYGSLEAKVPPQAIGFLIDTPATRVIDLGTEFAVTVANNGNTNINVLNGEVEAEPGRPLLTGGGLRHKLFEGDSLRLSPPVTKSFRVDFDAPDALDVFDIVRPDPATCLLDPEAGLLTLRTRIGSISGMRNDNSNVIVVPVPDCNFEAVLKVKRFEPVKRRANHVSLAALDGQDNVYRVSYWLNLDLKRGFAFTKEENAHHSFVQSGEESEGHLFDMEDRPFRLRLVRKGNTISTYWSEASGPWVSNGEASSQHKLRFVGFFAAEGNWNEGTDEQANCIIDSFELKILSSEP